MKYSEIKPILKKLHAAGYKKTPRYGGYIKIWTKGEYHFKYEMMNWEVEKYSGDIDYILERINQEANFKLNEHISKYFGAVTKEDRL